MGVFIFCLFCLIVIGLVIYCQVMTYKSVIAKRKLFVIGELAKAEERVYACLTFNDQELVKSAIVDFNFYLEFYKEKFGADEQYQYWLNKLNEIMTFSK